MRLSTALLALALAAATAATAQTAGPSFSKAFSPSTIGPGNLSMLTFTIDNTTGSTPLTGLSFSDTFPAGMTVATPAAVSTTCSGGSGRDGATPTIVAPEGAGALTFTNGGVGAGRSCVIRVNVTSATPGAHVNTTGDLTFDGGGNAGTASATLTVEATAPTFSKGFSPAAVALGGRSRLTLTIENPANAGPITSLSFTDDLPSGMTVASPSRAATTCAAGFSPTFTAGGSTISFDYFGSSSSPAVADGATCTVGVDVVTSNAGALANVTSDLSYERFGTTTLSAGKAGAVLTSQVGTLVLTKSFLRDPVPPGGTVPLRFTLRNIDRGGTASAIAFDDDLGAALAGLAAAPNLSTPACGGTLTSSPDGSVLSLTGGTLGSGATCAFEVDVTVPAGAATGEYVNETTAPTGTVLGAEVVGRRATASLFVEPVPLLTKTFVDNPLTPGATAEIEFTITNTSADFAAESIAFSDPFGDALGTFPAADVTFPADGFCGSASTVTPTFASGGVIEAFAVSGVDLAAGASCTFSVSLALPADFPGGDYTNTTSEVTAVVGGQTLTGPAASDVLTVVAGPRLAKFFEPAVAAPGEVVSLTFRLVLPTATGPSATDVAFSDSLELALPGLAAAPGLNVPACGGTLTSSFDGAVLSFSGGTLAPAEVCEVSVDVTVPAGAAAGTYENVTSPLASTYDGFSLTGAAARADLVVSPIRFTKAFLDDPVAPGGTVTLEFTLANLGPDDASSLGFTDNVDEALDGLALTGALPNPACGGTLSSLSGGGLLFLSGGSLLSGETCSFVVSLTVPAGAADGMYTNVTSDLSASIGGSPSTLPGAADDLEVASVVPDAPPTLAAAFDPTSIVTSATSRLTLTVENFASASAVGGLAVTAPLPGALTIAGTPDATSTCGGTVTAAAGSSALALSGGTVAAGTTCEVSALVTSPVAATYTVATDSLHSDLGTTGGASATLAVVAPGVTAQKAGVFVDGDGDELLGPGEVLTYRVRIRTNSPVPVDLTFTDTPDANTTIVASSLTVVSQSAGSSTTTEGTEDVAVALTGFRGTAVIDFQVIMDAPYPLEVAEVCNQGTVAGAGPDVLTDDPSTTDAFDATCTPTIFNRAPEAVAAADQTTAECTGAAGAAFALDGSGSSDPDGDVLTYTWTGPFPEGGGTVTGVSPTVTLPLGESTVTLTVADPLGASDSADLTLTVEDTTPPTLTVGAAPLVLWPPNHAYRTVSLGDLALAVSDACDTGLGAADVVVTQVASDEPENGTGDGNTTDDIVIAPTCDSVDVRIERKGNGNGRVYAFDLAVADASGNGATAGYEVSVPKTPVHPATRDAAAYVVTGCPSPAAAVAAAGDEAPEGVGAAPPARAIPEAFGLGAAFPNPTGRSARIGFDLPEPSAVRLEVFDALGRRVALLLEETVEAGSHEARLDAAALPSGTYLVRFSTGGGFVQTRPLTVLR